MVNAKAKTNARPVLSIPAAAVFMQVKERQARVILTRIHKANPEMGLLTRPSGSPRGNYQVDAEALLLIIRKNSGAGAIEALNERVAMLEADVRTLTNRMRKF